MKNETKIDDKEKTVLIKINTKIYPLPIIYQVADVFIDRAYVFLDGEPSKIVNVIIKAKDGNVDLKTISGEFNNELINYSAYFVRRQMNKELIETMMKKAFQTVSDKDECTEMNTGKKIDLGASVPLVERTETKNRKKLKQISNSSKKFNMKEVSKSWDKQKGAIKKVPKEYGKR